MMENNIENIVRKTLNERYELNRSLRLIIENEESSDDEKLDGVLDALMALSDEGKSEEEIEGSLDESITSWLTKTFGLGNDKSSDGGGDTSLSLGNLGSKAGSGVFSQMREWFIRKGLGFLGFEGALADAMAAMFADLDIRAIIALFRGGNACQQYGDQIADAILEGIGTYVMGGAENNSMAQNLLRNMVFEFEKSSQIGEIIASKVCSFNVRGALTNSI